MTGSLFDGPAPVRADAPVESAEAAAAVQPSVSIRRRRVLLHVAAQNMRGIISDELEQDLGMPHQSASACLHWLERQGFIRRDGRRRPTRTGAMAGVYVVTPDGRAALAVEFRP